MGRSEDVGNIGGGIARLLSGALSNPRQADGSRAGIADAHTGSRIAPTISDRFRGALSATGAGQQIQAVNTNRALQNQFQAGANLRNVQAATGAAALQGAQQQDERQNRQIPFDIVAEQFGAGPAVTSFMRQYGKSFINDQTNTISERDRVTLTERFQKDKVAQQAYFQAKLKDVDNSNSTAKKNLESEFDKLHKALDGKITLSEIKKDPQAAIEQLAEESKQKSFRTSIGVATSNMQEALQKQQRVFQSMNAASGKKVENSGIGQSQQQDLSSQLTGATRNKALELANGGPVTPQIVAEANRLVQEDKVKLATAQKEATAGVAEDVRLNRPLPLNVVSRVRDRSTGQPVRGELTQAMINKGNFVELTPPQINSENEAKDLIGQINNILSLHKPEFSGPIEGKLGAAKAKLPFGSKFFKEGESDFRAAAKTLEANLRKFYSGTAVSVSELKRNIEAIPDLNLADESFISQLKNALSNTQNKLDLLSKGQLFPATGGNRAIQAQSVNIGTKKLSDMTDEELQKARQDAGGS